MSNTPNLDAYLARRGSPRQERDAVVVDGTPVDAPAERPVLWLDLVEADEAAEAVFSLGRDAVAGLLESAAAAVRDGILG